jgi:hypothetical protein
MIKKDRLLKKRFLLIILFLFGINQFINNAEGKVVNNINISFDPNYLILLNASHNRWSGSRLNIGFEGNIINKSLSTADQNILDFKIYTGWMLFKSDAANIDLRLGYGINAGYFSSISDATLGYAPLLGTNMQVNLSVSLKLNSRLMGYFFQDGQTFLYLLGLSCKISDSKGLFFGYQGMYNLSSTQEISNNIDNGLCVGGLFYKIEPKDAKYDEIERQKRKKAKERKIWEQRKAGLEGKFFGSEKHWIFGLMIPCNAFGGDFTGFGYLYNAEEAILIPKLEPATGIGIVWGERRNVNTKGYSYELSFQESKHKGTWAGISLTDDVIYQKLSLDIKIYQRHLGTFFNIGYYIPWILVKDGAGVIATLEEGDATLSGYGFNVGLGKAFYPQDSLCIEINLLYQIAIYNKAKGVLGQYGDVIDPYEVNSLCPYIRINFLF